MLADDVEQILQLFDLEFCKHSFYIPWTLSVRSLLALNASKSNHAAVGHEGSRLDPKLDPNCTSTSIVTVHSCKDYGTRVKKTFTPTLNRQTAVKSLGESNFGFNDLWKSYHCKHFTFFMLRWFNLTWSIAFKPARLNSSGMWTMLWNCRDLQHDWLNDFAVSVTKID